LTTAGAYPFDGLDLEIVDGWAVVLVLVLVPFVIPLALPSSPDFFALLKEVSLLNSAMAPVFSTVPIFRLKEKRTNQSK
jgi:hypothetical protein